jgi:hypothetical protein
MGSIVMPSAVSTCRTVQHQAGGVGGDVALAAVDLLGVMPDPA